MLATVPAPRAVCPALQGSDDPQVSPELAQQHSSFPDSTGITMHQTMLRSPLRGLLTHQNLRMVVWKNTSRQQNTLNPLHPSLLVQLQHTDVVSELAVNWTLLSAPFRDRC